MWVSMFRKFGFFVMLYKWYVSKYNNNIFTLIVIKILLTNPKVINVELTT